jgi:methionyl-tRNA synthetase
MNLARAANKYFNDSEPWKTSKANPGQCATTLHICLQVVRSLAILFEPVVPFTAQRLWSVLNLPGTPSTTGWDSAGALGLAAGHTLHKAEILVMKIEDQQIENVVQALSGGAPAAPVPVPIPEFKQPISLDEFKKIDLRVAKVVEAEKVPKSEKLLKLQIEIGGEKRQILAGIAQHYKPEDLIGKSIVVVANLQAAKLMGHESQGMLLAANDAHGKVTVVLVSEDVPGGSVVR